MAQIFLAFDTETGGLTPKQDLLTFYGAMMDENYQILEELDLKLKPNDGRLPNVEVGALKVNGIDIQKHLADPTTVDYATGGKLLKEMIKRHLKKNGRYSNILSYGYNIFFDEVFVKAYLMTDEEWVSMVHYKRADIMAEVDMLKRHGWLPRELGSLVTVIDFFGLPKRPAHVAKNDILMTIDVDKKIKELMESKKSGGSGGADLISLLEAE
jgi:hypothetical protein